MLVDIFARRYEGTELRNVFEVRDSRLLNQAFRILSEDIYPYFFEDGKLNEASANFWIDLQSKLSRELGLNELFPQNEGLYKRSMYEVCEKWMSMPVAWSPDEHIKERLSLIELGFRTRENQLIARQDTPISKLEEMVVSLNKRAPPNVDPAVWAKEQAQNRRDEAVASFRSLVDELNTRFRQAKYGLNYHNGYIQVSSDDLVQIEIETPFWSLISDPIWKNVDLDMKEALDLRDSDGRDPAFYAARALESTIKIISDHRGWTHGGEKGAHSYIENLASKKNGFVNEWESTLLKEFFTHVRNPFGHGAGRGKMPSLSRTQTEWAIEFSMIWIKNLVRRL